MEPGETKRVSLVVPREDLAYYNVPAAGWTVEGGDYLVEVGASSRDIRVQGSATVTGDTLVLRLDADSTLAEWLSHPMGGQVLGGAFAAAQASGDGGEMTAMLADPELMKMVGSMPLSRMAAFPGSPLTPEILAQLVAAGNA